MVADVVYSSPQEVLPRWQRFGELLTQARNKRLAAAIRLRQQARQMDVAVQQISRLQQWLDSRAQMLQDILSTDIANNAQAYEVPSTLYFR